MKIMNTKLKAKLKIETFHISEEIKIITKDNIGNKKGIMICFDAFICEKTIISENTLVKK
jgi:hypothetical protein